ncbi:MAG: 50S ribosomal protein L10 [Tissierellia bacterium]|nr:50S ribosomal protein L10 [Tissierellia bacterium]
MKDKVLEQKQAVVAEIKEKIENSPSVVLVDYRGLTVEEITQLRDEYRANGVDYKVYKNTLMRFAFKELGYEDFNEYLTGPNALAIAGEDATSAARITQKFAKDNDKLEIKAGLIEGKIIDLAGVKELASIPSREVLIAKLLGSLKAPVSNLVYLLDAIAKQKEEAGEEVVEPVTEEPVAEEVVVEEAVAEEPAVEEPVVEACPIVVEEEQTEEVVEEATTEE